MADFVLVRKSRNIASSLLHTILNILLGVTAVVSTLLLNTPALGLVLVFLSKWRVLAVRMRFWWPNIKANLVDLIVGVSIVLLTYYSQAGGVLVGVLFSLIYCGWLLFIKPLSSEKAALLQSMIAVFLGISAVTLSTAGANILVPVLLSFVVGYAASRHILSQSNELDYTLTTLTSGLFFAETMWLGTTWAIVYPFFGIRIPQVAIILTIFIFVYNYARQAMIKYQDDFRFKHILGPVVFGAVLVGIIVIGFSKPMFNL